MNNAEFEKMLLTQDEKMRICLEDTHKAKKAGLMLSASKNAVISGCGDKYIIAMISKYLADYCSKKRFEVYHSRVLANYTPKSINKDSVVFFLTSRGKTIDVIDAIKEVKKKNAKIIVITQLEKKDKDSIYSALKGYKDYEIIIPVKNEKITKPSTATSNTFLSIMNAIIFYSINEELDIDPCLITLMVDLPMHFEEINNNKSFHDWCIKSSDKIKKAVNPFLVFTGDGPRYPVCKKASQIQFLEQCKLLGSAMQSEEFANLIVEEYLKNDLNQVWVLLKPIEPFCTLQAMNRFNEMQSMAEERLKKDRIIIIDPLQFANISGEDKINDILLTPLYVLMIEWLSYYCSY